LATVDSIDGFFPGENRSYSNPSTLPVPSLLRNGRYRKRER